MDQFRMRSNSRFSCLRLIALGLGLLGFGGCGGGGSQSGPPPSADFNLSLNPTTVSLNAGGSAPVNLTANALNGFNSQVSVQISGLPAGVSVLSASVTLTPGTAQQITLSGAANAPSVNDTVTFTGTSGSLTHTASLQLRVNGASNRAPGRTRYVRTDATTEYPLFVNQHWILYHTATARYFVSDPSSNEIIVLDAASETVIARIGVPGAFGLDDTPDHSTIYVGTQVGDVYTVDPVAMTVQKRYIASGIGPYGFEASQVLVMADGQVALIGIYNGIDGTVQVALWNPADNSATVYDGLGAKGLPCNLQTNFGGFARTVDRTQIFIGAINGGGLCEFNPATGQSFTVSTGSDLHITPTPDGKYVVVPRPTNDGVEIFDATNLTPVSNFSVQGGTGSSSGFAVSADSTTLYVPQDSVIYAYNLATGQQIGWLPNVYVQFSSGGSVFGPLGPYLLATDGSGLFAGPTEEGVGFVDLSKLNTGPVGSQFLNGYLNPATGPASGGTSTQWADPNSIGLLESVYFDANQATSISASSGNIKATTPAGKPGPADVYAFTSDGGMQLLPEAFSYGPTILEVTPNMATAEGGGAGYIYGYGFGPTSSSTIPSNLTVKVGGITAPVTGFNGNAYNLLSPPFPLESLTFTIPPGTSGASVDVTVTTSSGSATASGTFAYLPATQQFPLAGSELAQGIYDRYTSLYYFTDATKIQVFSRAQGKWLNPISFPSSAQRLWGIALSPNGSHMAVSDLSSGNIYVLTKFDTSTPSFQTFSVRSVSTFVVNPSAVAISDTGEIYFAVVVIGQGGGADQFFKLDTSNAIFFNYLLDFPGGGTQDAYLRGQISSDNARVFFNGDGAVFSIDTTTDKVFFALESPSCCYGNYELALSSNQTQFTATFYIYNSNLDDESYYALNDREIQSTKYIYGAKLSADGRLLFQPSANGIDVFDGNLGNLIKRISTPFELSPNYDALVSDGADSVLVAITGATGNGIAIVDLTSLVEPPTLLRIARADDNLISQSRRSARLIPNKHPEFSNTRALRVPHKTRDCVRMDHSTTP